MLYIKSDLIRIDEWSKLIEFFNKKVKKLWNL